MHRHSQSHCRPDVAPAVPTGDPVEDLRDAVVTAMHAYLTPLPRLVRRAIRSRRGGARRVHQLRVALRQAGTMLEVYRPLIDSRRFRRMNRALRRIRRAAGKVREWDVLRGMLVRQTIVDGGLRVWIDRQLQDRRERTGRNLGRRARRFRSRRFQRQVADLCRNAKWRAGPPPTLDRWARDVLAGGVARLAAAASQATRDVNSLHRLRIAAKRVRYMLNLLPPTLDPRLGDDLRQATARLQNQLGELNDQACQIRQLRDIAKQAPPRWAAAFHEFLVVRHVALEGAVEEFFRNW